MTGETQATHFGHEVVVEVYDGIELNLKCVTCRVRIPIRPERSAARLVDLNYLAREHAPTGETQAEERDRETPDLMAALIRSFGLPPRPAALAAVRADARREARAELRAHISEHGQSALVSLIAALSDRPEETS